MTGKNVLSGLYPTPVWNYFSEILAVPRPSKKEGKIIAWLLEFAERHSLPAKTDLAGNVLISKPATLGREMLPVVVMQSHLDMVCEKNNDVTFDFEQDKIVAQIRDGWVTASGTTLGADNGIGIAAQLALLAADDVSHGPIECLFTVDEETGLTGANALMPGFISGKILINLDSEDDGEIFIGCAGGIDTTAFFKVETSKVPSGFLPFRLEVYGLLGGHSGDEIHKGLGNANKIMARFLISALEKHGIRLARLEGGNLRNAIAREASAIVLVPEFAKASFLEHFKNFTSTVQFEYSITDPGLKMEENETAAPEHLFSGGFTRRLLQALVATPHGVLEWSSRMPGMVETSTNLAAVKLINDNIVVTTSQRSEIDSRKTMAATMVESLFLLAGAEVTHSDGYPGWAPNPDSAILKVAVESYRRLFSQEPIVRSIHAGLECGLFLEKYPGLDMVSIGPTIKGAHSPGERIDIATVGKFWDHLKDMLEHL